MVHPPARGNGRLRQQDPGDRHRQGPAEAVQGQHDQRRRLVDYSLYSEEIATFGESDYDQKDSAGFINLYGLPIKVKAMVDAKNKK